MATVSRIRTMIQTGFALFCLFVGYRFYQFYSWMIGQSETYTPRPASVEAFLPIGALLGLKRLLLTGKWDEVHPAGLTIFISAIILAIFLRKGFCGWICPDRFCIEHYGEIGQKIGLGNLSAPLAGLSSALHQISAAWFF